MPGEAAQPEATPPEHPPRLVFRRCHRLSGSAQFDRVFKTGLRKAAGPLLVLAAPNGLPHHRLGLSIGKRVGGAVRRARVKRHLREAFRLSRSELPTAPGDAIGYDWVIAARPHEAMPTERYQELFTTLAARVSREWHKREAR